MGKAFVAIIGGVLILISTWWVDHSGTTETALCIPSPVGSADCQPQQGNFVRAPHNSPVVARPVVAERATTGSVPQSAPAWLAIEPNILPKTELNPAGVKAVNGVVIPSDNRPAFRVDSNKPGTDSPGTTFIVGHNYVDRSGEFVPFSALARVERGDQVVLGTANGELVYTVQQAFRVPKHEMASRADLLVNVPGRLILETCATDDGRDTRDNLVVITQLATAK